MGVDSERQDKRHCLVSDLDCIGHEAEQKRMDRVERRTAHWRAVHGQETRSGRSLTIPTQHTDRFLVVQRRQLSLAGIAQGSEQKPLKMLRVQIRLANGYLFWANELIIIRDLASEQSTYASPIKAGSFEAREV